MTYKETKPDWVWLTSFLLTSLIQHLLSRPASRLNFTIEIYGAIPSLLLYFQMTLFSFLD